MPLSKLFADRLHYFKDLPFGVALEKYEAHLSEYQSPSLAVARYSVTTDLHSIDVMRYRPTSEHTGRPALIWMHGGGFSKGHYLMTEGDVVAREMAFRGDLVVFNVEYRLVSDTIKFPQPIEDCAAVLNWVHEHALQLGVDPERIFMGGISAGGCLAASVAVLDRDLGRKQLAGLLLNCPVLHRELPPASLELKSKLDELDGFGINADMVQQVNAFAVAPAALSKTPEFWWAGDCADLGKLPPIQIINCEYDALRSSGEKFASELRSQGGSVELITQLGVPHAHLNRYPQDCLEVSETLQHMVRFIKTITGQV